MKYSNFFFFIFIFFICQNIFCQKKIYISPQGLDSNNGMKGKPIYSLQKAFELAKNEKTSVDIIVNSGQYFIEKTLTINNDYNRQKKNRIKIIGDKNNLPVFFGGRKLLPYQKEQNGFWYFDINDEKKSGQIFTINGELKNLSRFPKTNFIKTSNAKIDEGCFTIKIPPELNVIFRKLNLDRIKRVFVTFYVKWTNIIRYIDNYDPKESTLTFKGLDFPDYYNVLPNKTLFKLNNIEISLSPGEWYYKDSKTIIYNPLKHENIKTSFGVVSSNNKVFAFNGDVEKPVSNINFENLVFNTWGEGLEEGGYFPYQSAANIESIIELSASSNISFNNITVCNLNTYAFWIKDNIDNVKITNSKFYNLGAGAVKIGLFNSDSKHNTSKVIVKNCNINKGGLLYPDSAAIIVFDANSNQIINNQISDFSYTAISLGWVWGYGLSYSKNNLVAYNHIYNIGKHELDDLGGIYTLGNSDGTVIYNNVIHDINANNYGGWGIFADEGSSGILIKNNLVYNCNSAGFHQHFGENNIVTNNIFAYNGEYVAQISKPEDHQSFEFKNNLLVHKNDFFFNDNWGKSKILSVNNIYYNENNKSYNIKYPNDINPLFINPELTKIGDYYYILNPLFFKQTKFNYINYSTVGIEK